MEAFFLQAARGQRFCVHHAPQGAPGSGIVFVPALAEEMNKSRHIVAQTARRLAANGVGVLLIDLFGCGDSSGSLADVRWADWRADIRLGLDWMRQRNYRSLQLWGQRTGAVLAAEVARDNPGAVRRCLFWQPAVGGEAILTQFLRLRSVNALLTGSGGSESVKQLRARLIVGELLEVAGYPLSPALAADLAGLNLERANPLCPVHWIELVAEVGRAASAASARVLSAWQAQGTDVSMSLLAAEQFWAASNAVELVQCPSIVEKTVQEVAMWH